MAAPPQQRYDSIGSGYSFVRHPDRRIEAQIHAALGPARRVLNLGAGAGSYEPGEHEVIAVEPAATMIAQRPADAAPAVRAIAGDLPFADNTFDASMALLTIHHWPDPMSGLAELRRVTSGPVVVFTFDAAVHSRQWLVTDYLPWMTQLDRDLPASQHVLDALGSGSVEVVPVPHDCTDGFCHAYWRRPHAYLDPAVRAGISGIARLDQTKVDAAMTQLEQDLSDGTWMRQHEDLMTETEIDAGYRLVVSNSR